MIEQCSRCERFCAIAGSAEARDGLMIYGRDLSGQVVCDACGANDDIAHLASGQPTMAYLASDGLSITSWGGSHIGYVETRRVMRNGFHGSEVMAWSGVANDGTEVYGRGAGRGMATSVRPRKRAGSVVVRADD